MRSALVLALVLLCGASATARVLHGPVISAKKRDYRKAPALAYASVGKSGDFTNAPSDRESNIQTWTVTCGVGWLYGLGVCIGPFYGVGVGLTFPGGVLAGAGGGVGITFGIGFGSGIVWGGGRGDVKGFGVVPPMLPPFANGLPRPADLPTMDELSRRASREARLLRMRMSSAFSRRRAWDDAD
jgi:hypothetical protein